jgi:sugar phosphate isomerase/epimerase
VHLKDFTDGKVVPVGQGDGQVRETLLFLKDQGWGGVLSIEPHLQFAGERSGFTGPESFAIATNTIKELLGSI